MSVDLSVVLACYNEGSHLRKNALEIKRVLDSTRYSYELVFVDDCSTDGSQEIISRLCAENGWRSILHSTNEGRGKSVSDGLRLARGRVAGCIDPDLEIPAYVIVEAANAVADGADIACARRIYKTTLDLNDLTRFALSAGYAGLVKLMLNLPAVDTEAGCKFFNRQKLVPVLNEVRSTHWSWDTEIIAACVNRGLKVTEIPVPYVRRPDKKSSVRPLRDTIDYLKFLSANAGRLRYKPQ